jgi:flagellar hook protein FlgE
MGLASALSTALTGLSAAETTIDVVGNNLANSNTVGFKASQATFATQFLQTLSLGAQPTDSTGGTNPRQTGLGTMVADITPNFTQGTVEISSNPTDMAIQGDGFFIVEGSSGEQLYTRNGVFKLNSENQLVTITGNRLLGFDAPNFEIQRTELKPITIPLGAAAVAQPTANVFLEGTLSPTGDVADVASRIETDILGNAAYTHPETTPGSVLSVKPLAGTSGAEVAVAGGVDHGTYQYRIVYADRPFAATGTASESPPSDAFSVTVAADDTTVRLTGFPAPDVNNSYKYMRIYRTEAGGSTFRYVSEVNISGGMPAQVDDGLADATLHSREVLNEATLKGKYQYYITYVDTTSTNPLEGLESRPSDVKAVELFNSRVQLSNLTVPASPGDWKAIRIYRNLAGSGAENDIRYMTQINFTDLPVTFTDNYSDDAIKNNKVLDQDGPKVDTTTKLLDVRRRVGSDYNQVFDEGTLELTARKGGRELETKQLTIDDTTTVENLLTFMEQSMGIQESPGPDPNHIIPPSTEPQPTGAEPGGLVDGGRIILTANNGYENRIEITSSSLRMVTTAGSENVNLPFGELQAAKGESAVTDCIVYDSLGIPLRVRVTAVLERRDNTGTYYRWFADSPDNEPADSTDQSIGVGTGMVVFDGEGDYVTTYGDTVEIYREDVSSVSPLRFELNFESISGLATSKSSLAVSRQDGSAPGVLNSFIVGEDGTIRGVFSNGISRDLGLIRLVRFANSAGLEQKGENLFAEGVNSGLPVQADPGDQGVGKLIAGAVELSNTDIGGNLIDLILASTMYRGNTRVITTVQQMIEELLSLRR